MEIQHHSDFMGSFRALCISSVSLSLPLLSASLFGSVCLYSGPLWRQKYASQSVYRRNTVKARPELLSRRALFRSEFIRKTLYENFWTSFTSLGK